MKKYQRRIVQQGCPLVMSRGGRGTRTERYGGECAIRNCHPTGRPTSDYYGPVIVKKYIPSVSHIHFVSLSLFPLHFFVPPLGKASGVDCVTGRKRNEDCKRSRHSKTKGKREGEVSIAGEKSTNIPKAFPRNASRREREKEREKKGSFGHPSTRTVSLLSGAGKKIIYRSSSLFRRTLRRKCTSLLGSGRQLFLFAHILRCVWEREKRRRRRK